MPRRKPKEQHPLDALAEGDPLRVIALMLWKARMREPDLFVQIFEKDIKGLDDCTNYLEVVPRVDIHRPQGEPAQPALQTPGRQRAVPARPAQPAKPYVIVTLVDESGNMIKPVENNEVDFDASQEAANVRKARDQAADIAQRIVHQAHSGEFSLSDIQDAADALVTLARAV